MEEKSPDIDALDLVPSASASEPPLGKTLAEGRQKRGLSADDVALRARIPQNYVKMIESDDYALISDQLYLVPFVRRYAAFLQLDAEEAAMRFVREVQRADGNAVRMSEPIAMNEKRRSRWRVAVPIVVAIIILVACSAFFFYRHFTALRTARQKAAATLDTSLQPRGPAVPLTHALPGASAKLLTGTRPH